jgi:LmbE family N-acetylglucosaminyl deacetylase
VNITVVVAHQDDERTCLATLLRLKGERADVRITLVALTNGEKGMSWDASVALEDAARTRRVEMQAVADALGAAYVCLNRTDGFLAEDRELRLELIETLRASGAELVFTHYPRDYNPDHVVTAEATCTAALFSEIASIATATPALPAAPRIFHLDPGAGYGFEATHFVAFDAELAAEKARIIRLHASQMEVMAELYGRDFADRTADEDRARGARLPADFAEGFAPCLMDRRIPRPGDLPS